MKQFRPEDDTTAEEIRRYAKWFLEAYEQQGAAPPTLGEFERYLKRQCPDLQVRSDFVARNFNSLSTIMVTYDRRMIWRDRARQVAWEKKVNALKRKKKK